MIYKIALSVVILLVAYMLYKNNTMPSYLGVSEGKFAPMPSSPNAVSSQTEIEEKKVMPISFADLGTAKKNVNKVLSQMSRNHIASVSEQYIHVVFTTPTMKYNDDIEIYFDIDKNLIHYRSQSRVGYSDAGVNRNRYEEFSKLYNDMN